MMNPYRTSARILSEEPVFVYDSLGDTLMRFVMYGFISVMLVVPAYIIEQSGGWKHTPESTKTGCELVRECGYVCVDK